MNVIESTPRAGLSRRSFLQATAALGAAAFPGPAAAEDPAVLNIIDTHQHLWDLSRFSLPWTRGEPALAHSFVMDDYRKATGALKGARVVKAVYMEVDVASEQQQAEADYITRVCAAGDTPTVAAVISGRPESDEFARYVQPFKGNKYIKGIRRVLHGAGTPPGTCTGKEFVRNIGLLGDLGLSFDLCMRAAELPDADRLIVACPGTRFILDHCGNARVGTDLTQWKKDLAAIARRPNVVCKVSGVVASAKPGQWQPDDLAPIVNHTLDTFGPDRVMFGGDWPVCTLAASLAQWVDALRAIVRDRKPDEQRKLFHDNAARFYNLG